MSYDKLLEEYKRLERIVDNMKVPECDRYAAIKKLADKELADGYFWLVCSVILLIIMIVALIHTLFKKDLDLDMDFDTFFIERTKPVIPVKRIFVTSEICLICCVKKSNAVYDTCGHQAYCMECAYEIPGNNCSICRSKFKRILSV